VCLKRRADNEDTLRTIIASCIGSERVSEPYCRAAGAQQIRAECNRATTLGTPDKTLEKAKQGPGQKNARACKKSGNKLKKPKKRKK
jgi:hypothetical protein